MNESKIELTERLRRQGRWGEASRFKDTALREFRGKGMTKAEAAEAAWNAMAEAYPPLANSGELAPEAPNEKAGGPSMCADSGVEGVDAATLELRARNGEPLDFCPECLRKQIVCLFDRIASLEAYIGRFVVGQSNAIDRIPGAGQ
jgi:hypothetical protein